VKYLKIDDTLFTNIDYTNNSEGETSFTATVTPFPAVGQTCTIKIKL
jgi:hypothetical protein